MLPLPETGTSDLQAALAAADADDWYTVWRTLSEPVRNPLRTYTIRRVRPAQAEVDVDFVVHPDTGPASRWVSTARVGDELMLIGPDALARPTRAGIAWQPGDADALLLAGDETATPAICAILESLRPDETGHAFIEIPDAADALEVAAPVGVALTWLPRGDAVPGYRLTAAVQAWCAEHPRLDMEIRAERAELGSFDIDGIDVDSQLLQDVPSGRTVSCLYAWIAGEAAAVKRLRRYLVTDIGIDRTQVAFMGYWRHGKSEIA